MLIEWFRQLIEWLFPREVPFYFFVFGQLSLTIFLMGFTLIVLPYSVVSRVNIFKKIRFKILRMFRRMGRLSTHGPFYRLMVWCGKRCFCGRLSARCKAPTGLKARPEGSTECVVLWTPQLPIGPFHEESYVLAWRFAVAEGKEAVWREQPLDEFDLQELQDGRLKAFQEKLPVCTEVWFRVCAVNCKGRSPWSEEAKTRTMATARDDGGLSGLCGPASAACGEGRDVYHWAQTSLEVTVKVPIAQAWKAKNIKFKTTATTLDIQFVAEGSTEPPQVLLAGTLMKKVKPDEVFWQIEDTDKIGRHIEVQLKKAEAMQKWPSVLEGEDHPLVDVRDVRLFQKGYSGLDPGAIDFSEL